MFGIDLSTAPIPVNAAIFLAAAAIIWNAGARLVHVVDAISDKTGMAKAFAGMLILGSITSAPEISATLTSAGAGNPALAINNLLGSLSFNLIILVIACINYMNLATARATRRARSIGIRKILGASRGMLALQFLGEAIMFALFALVIGAVIVEVVLRFTPINALMGQQVSFNLLQQPELALWLLGLAVAMGLVAGVYPASAVTKATTAWETSPGQIEPPVQSRISPHQSPSGKTVPNT